MQHPPVPIQPRRPEKFEGTIDEADTPKSHYDSASHSSDPAPIFLMLYYVVNPKPESGQTKVCEECVAVICRGDWRGTLRPPLAPTLDERLRVH